MTFIKIYYVAVIYHSMKREGCVCFAVSPKSLKNVIDRKQCCYNTILYTNKTINHPYAHNRKGRSLCSLCSHPKKSGKYKRKQFKHDINQIRKEFNIL